MSPDEAAIAVANGTRVVLRTQQGDEHAGGRIISYSIVPTVTIETPDGVRIAWRHDLAEVAE